MVWLSFTKLVSILAHVQVASHLETQHHVRGPIDTVLYLCKVLVGTTQASLLMWIASKQHFDVINGLYLRFCVCSCAHFWRFQSILLFQIEFCTWTVELVRLAGVAQLPRVEPCVDTRQTLVLSVNMSVQDRRKSWDISYKWNEIQTETLISLFFCLFFWKNTNIRLAAFIVKLRVMDPYVLRKQLNW